jgi:sulfhydrogenase subunit alpha
LLPRQKYSEEDLGKDKKMNRSIIVDHLCRVEGHGCINVGISDGKVVKVNAGIFEGSRFFEPLIIGRYYNEITPILSRICAICSAVHTITSLKAVEDAFGIKVTGQTDLLRDLLIQGGNIESHALHLFCLAVPDYIGYTGAISLAKDKPELVRMGLDLKKLGNTIQETIGGRAVHPVNAVIGGFGKLPDKKLILDLKEQLKKGLQQAVKTIDIMAALKIPDFAESPTVYAALGPVNGKYSFFGNKIILSTGESIDIDKYKTLCNERVVKHSHAKHSLFKGKPFMVGSLARIMLNGHKLTGEAEKAMVKLGLDLLCRNTLYNNPAQAVEIVYAIERSIEIIDEFLKYGISDEIPVKVKVKAGMGTAACEAPRGMLFHSYTFDKKGRVTQADVVTPTAQNMANIEKDLKISTEKLINESEDVISDKLEMVARAYDPCISCSVHLIELNYNKRDKTQNNKF